MVNQHFIQTLREKSGGIRGLGGLSQNLSQNPNHLYRQEDHQQSHHAMTQVNLVDPTIKARAVGKMTLTSTECRILLAGPQQQAALHATRAGKIQPKRVNLVAILAKNTVLRPSWLENVIKRVLQHLVVVDNTFYLGVVSE